MPGIILTSFATIAPREIWEIHEGVEEIEEGPGNHYDVVDILQEDHHDGRVADTLKYRGQLADHGHSSFADVLADRNLQEKQGNSADDHREEIRNEKGS